MQPAADAELVAAAYAAFAEDVDRAPALTLRGGDALDDYLQPPPYDLVADALSDAYVERHFWGIGYLDAASWRHALPWLFAHALHHRSRDSNATDALLNSLRPPDREPPRQGSLTPEQELVVIRFHDTLAFASDSTHTELACLALEEWWAPGALYRPR